MEHLLCARPIRVLGVLQCIRQTGPLLEDVAGGPRDTPTSDHGTQVDLPAAEGAARTGFRAQETWVPSSNSAFAELGELQGRHTQE